MGGYINDLKDGYPLKSLPAWSRLKLPAWTYRPLKPWLCTFPQQSSLSFLLLAFLTVSHKLLCRECLFPLKSCSLTISPWGADLCSSPRDQMLYLGPAPSTAALSGLSLQMQSFLELLLSRLLPFWPSFWLSFASPLWTKKLPTWWLDLPTWTLGYFLHSLNLHRKGNWIFSSFSWVTQHRWKVFLHLLQHTHFFWSIPSV